MMAPSKKLLAALAAVFLLNILVIGGVQSLTTPALAAVYQQGSQGETVRQIQTKLKRWGYYDGEVDGIYGSATTEAVKYFQRRNGLTADGIAGNATLEPSITAAIKPAGLSGPQCWMISLPMDRAPLPEKGRSRARGMHSAGMPKGLTRGSRPWASTSTAPEARTMARAVSMASMAGKMESTVFRPRLAP